MKKRSQRSFSDYILFMFVLFSLSLQINSAENASFNKSSFTVGFAQDTLANDWRKAQVNQLKVEFKKYPNIKFIVTDAGGNSNKQIQDIEDLAHRKVDVLITSPRDGVASTPAISRIYNQGIPVVLITRAITSEYFTTLVAPDDYEIAGDAAKFMAKNYPVGEMFLCFGGFLLRRRLSPEQVDFLIRLKNTRVSK